MRKRKYIINLFAVAALLVGCGESLEDTYSDYAGDGKIRYVAKCTEVHATPGWERLLVEWINGWSHCSSGADLNLSHAAATVFLVQCRNTNGFRVFAFLHFKVEIFK